MGGKVVALDSEGRQDFRDLLDSPETSTPLRSTKSG